MTARRRTRLIVTAALVALAVGLWFLSPDSLIGLIEVAVCVLIIAFYWTASRHRR